MEETKGKAKQQGTSKQTKNIKARPMIGDRWMSWFLEFRQSRGVRDKLVQVRRVYQEGKRCKVLHKNGTERSGNKVE